MYNNNNCTSITNDTSGASHSGATDDYDDYNYDVTTITTTILEAIVAAGTPKPPLISDATKVIIEYVIHISLFYVTSCIGLVVNVINVIVYKKQGLKDSITLGLFALSISDLFVSGLPIETATCYLLKAIYPKSNINFASIHYIHSSWSRRMFYSLSCLITTLLSLERCMCVILPFKVKVIFTRSRTAGIIFCLVLFHMICYVPIFATHRLRWQDNPARNGTKMLKVWFLPNRDVIESFSSILMAIVTPTLAQAIVTCCAAIMINGLRQASKFRQAVTTSNNDPPTNVNTTDDSDKTVTSQQEPRKQTATLSPRDARLVRTMVFIVAILSACNVSYLIMTYALLAVPDLNISRPYQNTYSLIFSITYLLSTVNASLNFFIYYKTSTKYREVFDQVFCRTKKV